VTGHAPPVIIREESPVSLPEYARVSIAFRVESRFRIERLDGGLGGLRFSLESVEPYVKDYDTVLEDRPTQWPLLWDLSNWGFLSAFAGDERVGGAAIAWKTAGLPMLGGRDDVAILWDLRVHPSFRGQGIGRRLFGHALRWAAERGCTRLDVETQNINVPACRFYAHEGCVLRSVDFHAYGELDEVQLIWSIDLSE
jgi:GNAT superfamily N-acetyltransferase